MDLQKKLQPHRDKVSSIDEKILALLSLRKEEVLKIKEIKDEFEKIVHDPKREKQMQEIRHKLCEDYQLSPEKIDKIFAEILSWSRNIQSEQ